MLFTVLQIIILLFAPYLLSKLTRWMGTENWLSPVVCCYIIGMALGNFNIMPLDRSLANYFSQVTVMLAIPLLLYSTDLLGWLKLARTTTIGFGLMIVSTLIAAFSNAWFFKPYLPEVPGMAGMLTGIYIGGTPNLNAIGIAMEVSSTIIVNLNAAEIACGGIYLLLLTSVMPRFYGLILPPFQGDKNTGETELLPKSSLRYKDLGSSYGLTLLIVLASAGITWWFTGSLQKPGFIILLISALAVGASFSSKIRSMEGTYESGEYLLLIFSIAIGMMADFSELFSSGLYMIGIAGGTMVMALLLHLLLCRLFRIDRDTMIITSTAGIYGPPFIGQVAAVIKNRSLIFSGIATGLVGIAIANFLGVAMATLLERLFQTGQVVGH